jgi:23S rRNA pseudouridine1911/1915/1917 synthase
VPRLSRQYRDLSVPVTDFVFETNLPEHGARLDVVLRAHFPWKSRERFQAMIESGEVTVNGGRRKPATRLRKGDRVRVRIPVAPDAPAKESGDDLVVLYEDDALVAIDKPAGITAHPVGRIRHGTLINRLHARYRDLDDPQEDVVPRLAHRLDKDTSGVVLVVKDRRLDAIVTEAFHRREVRKTYLALVRGVPAADAGVVDRPIGPALVRDTQLHMDVRDDGQPALTRWRVVERLPGHAWLEVEPRTGRTHQIRVHLRSIGHPIVADHLYGDLRPLRLSTVAPGVAPQDDAVLLDRLGLHAHRLELVHPATRAPLRVESPVPADLARALAGLRSLARRAPAAAAS